jgi:diaminohydroxyphosphoribosylaminopyrimidine deaminase/5-amino-6-(5-phosphoribosylamino)uracil reductase
MPHSDPVWVALLAAARAARNGLDAGRTAAFALDGEAVLIEVSADDPRALLSWVPDTGWTPRTAPHDGADPRLALYLPLCGARPGHPVVVGHLAQSLDGYIATQAGESQWVTGEQNILHMHRLRALCDAVIVGADTVVADDSRLTTRLVPGPNPLRVVLDPHRRLGAHHRLFSDGAAPTLLVCDAARANGGERFGQAEVLGVTSREGRLDLGAVLSLLRRRGCHAVFVEGGGVTVSRFLDAGLLDRLQVTVAPLVIGQGRPGICLPPVQRLRDGLRPAHRVFRMGDDVLFDCDLRAGGPGEASGILSRVF